MIFPPEELSLIARLTSARLAVENKALTSKGEILKFFGIVILITKFEFGSRRSLWSTAALAKYQPAPGLGQTGMSRHRFDDIWKAIRFLEQRIPIDWFVAIPTLHRLELQQV